MQSKYAQSKRPPAKRTRVASRFYRSQEIDQKNSDPKHEASVNAFLKKTDPQYTESLKPKKLPNFLHPFKLRPAKKPTVCNAKAYEVRKPKPWELKRQG